MSMNPSLWMEAFAKTAGKQGIKEIHFHLEELQHQACAVFDGQREADTRSTETQLLVEACIEGYGGAAFTEDLSEEIIPPMLHDIFASARSNKAHWQPKKLVPQKATLLPFIPLADETTALAEAGAELVAAHTEVAHTSLVLRSQERKITLANAHGETTSANMANLLATASITAQKNGTVQTARQWLLASKTPSYRPLAKSCAAEAQEMLGAGPCSSRLCPTVLRADVMATLLEAYLPAFFAQRVNSGTSLLGGKLGQALASPPVCLTEDPGGVARRLFDDEGVPTQPKNLLNQGVLVQYLHNQKTAKLAGLPTGGNGYRSTYCAAVTTGYSNICLLPGTHSLAALLREMGSGVFITSCEGVFAGANLSSGYFSLQAKGYLVENGHLTRPLSQITIGGNFFSLLADIVLLSNGTGSTENPFYNLVFSPDVLVEKLQISG